MSNKLKVSPTAGKRQGERQYLIKSLLEYATAAVMLAVCCFVPFYVSNGYFNIGEDKYAAFKQCMIWGMPVLFVLFLVYVICHWKEIGGIQFETTDYFVIAYLFAVAMSVIAGGFLPNALDGYPGWHMGLLSQLMFGCIYFFTSKFGYWRKVVLIAWCICSTVVFWYGILNRLDYDVLGYYAPIDPVYKVTFISTLGQTSWYASFLAVVLPVGVASLIFGKNRILQVLGGLFSFVAFSSLVSANAESSYGAFAAMMLVFFWVASTNARQSFYYLISCDLFVLAGRFFHNRYMHRQNAYFWPDIITNIVIFNNVLMWGLFAVLLAMTITVGICAKKELWPHGVMKKLRVAILGLVVLGIISAVALIVLNTKGMLPKTLSEKLSSFSYFTWRETWGNNRGKTWNFSVELFANYPFLNKLFGVGPDCYYDYASTHYAERLFEMWGNQALTNAHNEWLNLTITTGLFGGICYLGIFISAFRAMMKRAEQEPICVMVAASIVSYMAYNFFCYQQVLCTPFIFMLMGFGIYVVRITKTESETCN